MLAMGYGVADMGLQTRHAVGAHDEPDLQRAEAATKRDLPVAIVGDEARVRVRISEVGGSYGEGVEEVFAFFYEETAAGCQYNESEGTEWRKGYKPAVKIGEKPLMHIHIEAVKCPKPGRKVLVLLTYQRRTGVCRIYMYPYLWVVLQNFDDLREVIDRACCRRAECHC